MALTVAGFHKEADAGLPVAGRHPAPRRLAGSTTTWPTRDEGPPARHQRVRLRGHRGVAPLPASPATIAPSRRMWPMLEAGRSTSCCGCSGDDGAILWSVDPDGHARALPAAHRVVVDLPRLRCGVACAETPRRRAARLGAGRRSAGPRHRPRTRGLRAQARVRHGLVLPGALRCARAARRPRRRIDGWWDTFVMEGRGVRCVSTGPWVTAAETAECALALDARGHGREALGSCSPGRRRIAATTARTGRASSIPRWRPSRSLERTTYTAGAIVLAADALSDATPAAGLFRGESARRRAGLDLTEPACGREAGRTRLRHAQRAALAVLDEFARRRGPRARARRGAGRRRPGRGRRRGWPASRPPPPGAPSPGSRPRPAPRRGHRR